MKMIVYGIRFCWGIMMMLFVFACNDEQALPSQESVFSLPNGFPQPDIPYDNEYTPERWALGKRLFFDTILSVDQSISCASCHRPEFAFTDGRRVSTGVDDRTGLRNAPTLTNIAYHPYLTREGGVPTLEMQVLVPIQEHAEFDFNILEIAERMKKDTTYVMASRIAYQRDPDPFVITRAISCFERTLVSGHSRYDQYLAGDLLALNATELHGKQLFLSERLSCSKCHSGFNFTDYRFDNTGLYESYQDQGRYRLTGIDADRALFKIPTLRNLSVTAPYMHDGSLPDLAAVIEHYNSGGKNHPHKSPLVRPLHLTIEEKKALLSFLNSLTDENFIYNKVFRP